MKKKKKPGADSGLIARNKRAFHLYQFSEKVEAGIVLVGTEVKGVRAREVIMQDCYAMVRNNEVFVDGLHIGIFKPAGQFNHPPKRRRKLLLHKKEIVKLAAAVQNKGCTLVPLRVYLKKRRIKIELGVGRGKKQYDHRDTLKAREAKRSIDRAMKEARRK